jgi:hypothetical protein
MLKRLKVSAYAAALAVVSLMSMGCDWGGWGGWWPYNGNVESWSRILAAFLREDLLG